MSFDPKFDGIWRELEAVGLADWISELKEKVALKYTDGHGDLARWLRALADLERWTGEGFQVREGVLHFLGEAPKRDSPPSELREVLLRLSPWRKGPFWFDDVFVDTEWRSDWKWDRLCERISPLAGRRIIDVGCGNGYHLWRMLAEGARLAMGVDPALLFGCQSYAMRHFAGLDHPVGVLPLGVEDLPAKLACFDTVFSMGVLYHRRSPIEHLEQLRDLTTKGGEVVLETLVVEGNEQTVLLPEGRYAMMRNVWFLPSVALLRTMLAKVGFQEIEVLDLSRTTIEEQRGTEWMRYQSLPDFLDPENNEKTIEGYPGPLRVVMRATK